MFYKNSSSVSRLYAALFCVFGCASLVFNAVGISAQSKPFDVVGQNLGGTPIVTATLNDAFPDPDGNGRAAAGEEVTYTATITNSGSVDATNVNYSTSIDGNSTLVANSVQVQPDLNQYAVRCTFTTDGGGGCGSSAGSYGVTDANFNTIIGGQYDYLNVTTSNASYNASTGIFQFDTTVQNLIPNAFGTLDGITLDASGVRLFVQSSRVNTGTGSVSVANADGTATFTAANQPYFQFNQILQQNEVSPVRTVQLSVPNTVGSFTVDFLISTKVQVKVVINEVLANPGGTISDPNGEWFELYNAGQFPVNLKNYLINDYAAGDSGNGCEIGPNGITNYCARPPHTIASDVIIQPGGYAVLGTITDTSSNGGVPVDYAYGASLALANSLDGVRLRTPNASIIDKVFYASQAISAQNGISRELKNAALDNANIDGSNWSDASATAVYGPGGRGTPKAQNSTFTPFAAPFSGKRSAPKTAAGKFVPSVPDAGETVTAYLGTISPGGSATVTYRVTIANPIPATITQVNDQGSVSGGNFGDVVTDDPATPAANDSTVTPVGLAPTAASVSISGRVSTPQNIGLTSALVTLTDIQGNSRTAFTGRGGRFFFGDVAAGATYILSVRSKRYRYAPQVINVTEDLTELNFAPQ